jgi:flagellar biosynthesis chaperone FliJ
MLRKRDLLGRCVSLQNQINRLQEQINMLEKNQNFTLQVLNSSGESVMTICNYGGYSCQVEELKNITITEAFMALMESLGMELKVTKELKPLRVEVVSKKKGKER